MVDFFLLIQIAGAGDELQGIKRGIMEMTDGIAVNKSDGNNIEKAQLAMTQIKNALHLFPVPPSGWRPKVLTCSSINKSGMDQIWDMIIEYLSFANKNNYFEERRNQQAKYWMFETINEALKNSFFQNPSVQIQLKEIEKEVLENRVSSFVAAKLLLDRYFEGYKQ
jgi:LAO/AO transport system kinase